MLNEPLGDIAVDASTESEVFWLPELNLSLVEIVEQARMNNYINRIPSSLFLGPIPTNKLARIEASVLSTADKIKIVCLQAYQAHAKEWHEDHVDYCLDNNLDPEKE